MKRARKIIVMLSVMVMLLGTCLVTNAAGTTAAIKAITAKQENAKGQMKNVSSIVIYTNDTDTAKPVKISYTWDKKTQDTTEPAGVRVTSSDRAVVNVKPGLKDISSTAPTGKSNTVTTTGELVLTPVSNGKATITITDKVNKKKIKKINVTVKTYADSISFSGNVETENNENIIKVTVGGKRNLGASVQNNATDKKLKYTVTNSGVKGGVTVDGKGNVSVKKAGAAAAVTVTSNDKKVKKEVKVVPLEEKVTSIAFVQDTTEKTDKTGLLNKKNVLCLKGNTASEAHTYQLMCLLNKGAGVEDLDFTSNKPGVAVVDESGKITAVGNGTAVITVTPKLGNKKSAKLTVKVTTDVEIVTVADTSFSIIANNKDAAKLAGATNANASDKTVLYSILSVKDTQTDAVIPNSSTDIKKYVSVDKKGNVKAKKPCIATIRAYSKANTSAERVVTVTAMIPVDKITISSGENQPVVNKNKVTLYKTGENTQQTLKLTASAAAKETGKVPGNTAVSWKSSKPSVAMIDEDGNVTAFNNGTTVLTATAADKSGKKASVTVTVKTDAYEINVAKAQTVSGNEVVYVEGEAGKTKTYKAASTIKAATNKDASDKKVKYSENSISLAPGSEKEITVTANDTRTHGNGQPDAATKKVTLKCVDKSEIARSYEITVNQDSVQLPAGESIGVTATVTPGEGKISTDLSKVTWKSKSAGTASVANGVITAKKAGNTTITVSYKYDGYKNETDKANGKLTKNLTVSKDINVYVGRSTKDVRKEVNKAFAEELKAENRDYTGIHTEFEEKNNRFVLNIVNPFKDFTQLKETGLVDSIETLVKNASINYRKLAITDTETNDIWQIVRNGIKVSVEKNGQTVLTDADEDEAISYVLKNTVGEDKLLKDWNGKKYDIALTVEENRSTKTFDYELNYTVDVVMSQTLYKQQIDQAVSEGITGLDITGIEDIVYNAAQSSMDILVGDVNQSIAEADKAARADLVAALEKVFEDAKAVTLTIETPIGKDVVTKNRTETNSTSEFINSLLDDYAAKLSERAETYGELNGSIVVLDVTYRLGTMEYAQSFKVNFVIEESAFDYAADKAVAEALTGKSFVFGKVTYEADENVLSVKFNKEYAEKAPENLAGTGIATVLDKLIENSFVDKEADIVVVVDGAVSTVKASEKTTDILSRLTEGIAKLGDMDGRTAVIKVPYKYETGNSAKKIVYSIVFSLADDVVTNTLTEETEEETTTEEESSTEEITTEEESTTGEETSTEEETATEEETSTEEETAAGEETSTEEETTTEEETSTEEETAAGEESLTEEETAMEEESSSEEMTTTEETAAEEVLTEQAVEETTAE